MTTSLAVYGQSVKPQKASGFDYRACMEKLKGTKGPKRVIARSPARDTLADNIEKLMAATPAYNSSPKIAAKTKMSTATINRVRRKEDAATLDTITAFANVFGLKTWQLLVPNLDPKAPPLLANAEDRRRIAEMIDLAQSMVDRHGAPTTASAEPR